MKIRYLQQLSILTALLIVTLPCHALRCGTQLVSEGDLALQVRDKCGEPVSEELIGYTLRPNQIAGSQGPAYARELKIEQWVYGPDMGYYNVMTFEGGRLKRIERIKN